MAAPASSSPGKLLHHPDPALGSGAEHCAALRDCIARFQDRIPALADVGMQLQCPNGLDSLIALYDHSTSLMEHALWSGEVDFHALLACYQALFREQEAWIARHGQDGRHHFIVAIPVADRPAHLNACLESLYQVCRLYDYGGHASGKWDRIQVLVAEDSRDPANIRRHIELAETYRQKGLQVIHYGQDEQYALLHALPAPLRARLGRLLTTQPRERFWLKGQAANRNLCYLKFPQLTQDRNRTLYYFIDSDESLCVNRHTDSGGEIVHALPYFHAVDRIFRGSDTLVLTGKMVGDPPVSPAVMAANFLDDVIAFFESLARQPARAACRFHGALPQAGDAAYHDMANLFGYTSQPARFPYACRLAGDHDHVACLRDFAGRLEAFFFGVHLTRRTAFEYKGDFTRLTPARTVYPGNYVVNHAGLKYVIPFGHLRLRMSGPTAGRLIAAEIGSRFAACNLPNLHRRTSGAGLEDDFRPGVAMAQDGIDLADEFERQFFGDLMLFATEALVRQADVTQPFAREAVEAALDQKESELMALYQQKQADIVARHRKLRELVFGHGHWWLLEPALTGALDRVRAFLANIERNFGEQAPAWRLIQSAGHRARRKRQLTEALLSYRAERDAWDSLF